ncbi:MAG: hypothetical protein ACYSTF_01110 [Planctomycetota bacterium]
MNGEDSCSFIPFLIVFIVCMVWWYRSSQRKKKLQRLLKEMKDIFANARKGEITKEEADTFFVCADEALAVMPSRPAKNSRMAVMKEEIEKMSSQITMILAVHAPTASLGEEIDKLAVLRQKGMISDLEFQAFSERFKLSTGDKASGVIKAISELSKQRKQGAMSDGNYHAALWSLLDKLDRKS